MQANDDNVMLKDGTKLKIIRIMLENDEIVFIGAVFEERPYFTSQFHAQFEYITFAIRNHTKFIRFSRHDIDSSIIVYQSNQNEYILFKILNSL